MSAVMRLALVLLLVGIAASVGVASDAAFRAVTPSAANRAAAGTVVLTDDDEGATLLALSGAPAGRRSSACVRVTYRGTLPAEVRHFATVTGAAAPHLVTRVTGGSAPTGAPGSCTGFTPDPGDHLGLGPGVVFEGPLSELPASAAAGRPDPAPGAGGAYANAVLATSGLLAYWRLGERQAVADTFAGPAGTPLPAHGADLGAGWTAHPASSGTVVLSGAGTVRKGSGDRADAYASGDPRTADYAVEADLVVHTRADAAGLLGRVQPAQRTYYAALYQADAGRWELWRVVDGTATQLDARAEALGPGEQHRLRLELDGAQVRLLVDGAPRLSATDPAPITAAGRGGLRLGAGSGRAVGDATGVHLGRFAVVAAASEPVDSKGANDATAVNGPVLEAPGAPAAGAGRALRFDGADDHLAAGGTALAVTDAFTIGGWFRWERGTHALMRDSTAFGGGIVLGWLEDDTLRYRPAADRSFDTRVTAGRLRDRWHHVMLSRSGTTATLYVDGAAVHTATGLPSVTAALPWLVMRDGTWFPAHAGGLADEVTVFGRGLSGAEVRALATAGLAPATWRAPTTRAFRYEVWVGDDLAGASKSASATLRWEALSR